MAVSTPQGPSGPTQQGTPTPLLGQRFGLQAPIELQGQPAGSMQLKSSCAIDTDTPVGPPLASMTALQVESW